MYNLFMKSRSKQLFSSHETDPTSRHLDFVQILIMQYYQLYLTLVAYYQSITPNNHHTTLIRATSDQNPNDTS